MKQLLCLLLLAGWLAGCNDKDNGALPEEGVEFSPATPYQEAYPGAVLSFKVRIRTAAPITRFGIRFKKPGSAGFVALPEYPDLQGNDAAAFANFKTFEYALPASTDTINSEMSFKFVASTATAEYEKDYTVRLVSAGRQTLRLYNPALRSYVNFSGLDVINGKGVEADAAHLIANTTDVKVPLTGAIFKAIIGWKGANGALFKQVTAANYNDSATKYAKIYSGIAAANELTGVSALLTATTGGAGALTTSNPFYIAKITNNSGVKYLGLSVKKYPPVNTSNLSTTTTLDSLNDYIQLEIKQ